ncbi:MAG: glycosyltransferase family 2 protein [Chitinophagales bacterium]|nr:glycosyltransferase family 2 protein [Chitinophagales bacterium]
MQYLSCYILTYNSEKHLPAILQQVAKVADEILLVDSGSADDTYKIGKEFGCRILYRSFDNYREQRAFAQAKCRYDHVLFFDSDEVPSDELIEKIKKLKAAGFTADCYEIRREWFVLGKKVHVCYPVVCPDYPVRLLNRQVVKFDERSAIVHETPHGQRNAQRIEEPIYHYTFNTKWEMQHKLHRYARLSAAEIVSRHKNRSWYKRIVSPVAAWFKWYLFKGAWRDGKVGWLMGMYAYQYTYLKYKYAEKM